MQSPNKLEMNGLDRSDCKELSEVDEFSASMILTPKFKSKERSLKKISKNYLNYRIEFSRATLPEPVSFFFQSQFQNSLNLSQIELRKHLRSRQSHLSTISMCLKRSRCLIITVYNNLILILY